MGSANNPPPPDDRNSIDLASADSALSADTTESVDDVLGAPGPVGPRDSELPEVGRAGSGE